MYGSKRHSIYAVELSQWYGKPCANCIYPSHPQQWRHDYRFLGKPVMRTRWMAGTAPHKSGRCRDESRSDKYTQTRISDICHRRIQVMKQISIRCNRIEHWVSLRCASIRLAQYTDINTNNSDSQQIQT